jgi:hypothetical protein
VSVSAGRSDRLHRKGEENQNVKNDDGKNSQKKPSKNSEPRENKVGKNENILGLAEKRELSSK